MRDPNTQEGRKRVGQVSLVSAVELTSRSKEQDNWDALGEVAVHATCEEELILVGRVGGVGAGGRLLLAEEGAGAETVADDVEGGCDLEEAEGEEEAAGDGCESLCQLLGVVDEENGIIGCVEQERRGEKKLIDWSKGQARLTRDRSRHW